MLPAKPEALLSLSPATEAINPIITADKGTTMLVPEGIKPIKGSRREIAYPIPQPINHPAFLGEQIL
ncbi:MAG: hypothetical protein ACOC6H_01485 [Thermoproteota archaeon]